MSGRVGDLSKEQEEKLEEFRHVISDVMRPEFDDYFLLRWLRARRFDVAAAEAMLRKCLKWRESAGIDTILNFQFPEIVHKYIPGNIIGHDKEGCPIWFIPYKNMNLKGWLTTRKLRPLLVKHIIACLEVNEEELKRQSEKLGRPVELFSEIFNLEDVNLRELPWNATLEFLAECFKMYEAYYPERLKVAYILNVPRFCEILINIAKMFLSVDTQKKIQVFRKGSDWKKALLEHIDPSELPASLGGTKVDPDGDPRCPSIVHYAEKLPTSYYSMSLGEYLSAHPESKAAVIPKSSIFPIEIVVEKAGSFLEWEFMTENHDIGFGVFLKRDSRKINGESCDGDCSDEGEQILIPTERVQSHTVPENGVLECDIEGTYVLKFDNTYSWYHTKKLYYNIKITPLSEKI